MKRKFLSVILILSIILGISYSGCSFIDYLKKTKEERIILEKRKVSWKALQKKIRKELASYKGIAGIVIVDLRTGWKISFNENKLFPSASLVKIPIMAASLRASQEKKINLNDKIILKNLDKVQGSGMLKEMPEGTSLSVGELIEVMVTQSDNTATNMLINILGFDYLNNYFKELGLENTNLSRKMMDFKYRRVGIENYTTPKDMAFILEKIYRKQPLGDRASLQCLNLLSQQKYNDRIPAKLPPDTVVAHKTGLERNVCHDVGIVYTDNGDFLICVLTKHPSTSKLSKRFISRIALETYNYYRNI